MFLLCRAKDLHVIIFSNPYCLSISFQTFLSLSCNFILFYQITILCPEAGIAVLKGSEVVMDRQWKVGEWLGVAMARASDSGVGGRGEHVDNGTGLEFEG